MSKRERELNVWRNARYYRKWFNYIEKIALTRIKWDGLPEEIDERYLERILMRQGKAVFYNAGTESDPLFVATKVTTNDSPDLYDNYHSFRSFGSNWNQNVPEGEGVMIWDNTIRKPYYDTLTQFADDLAELDTLINQQRRQQRQGVIITGPEHAMKNMERLKNDIMDGTPVMIGIKGSIDKNIEVNKIDLTTPYQVSEINNDKQYIMNELFSFLGIQNVSREKKQYLNTEEVTINEDVIVRVREDLLIPRDRACRAINEMYGLNVSVSWRPGALEDVTPVGQESQEYEDDENA